MDNLKEYKGSSQEKADKRYREKVSSDEELRKKRSKASAYRTAKSYVRNHSTMEELEELEQLIEQRKKDLNQ